MTGRRRNFGSYAGMGTEFSARSRRQSRQQRQLIRIAHDVNIADLPFGYIHCEYAKRVASMVDDDTRLPVDLGEASDNIFRHELGGSFHEEARHVIRSVNRIGHGSRLSAAICVEHDILGEKRQQSLHIAMSRGLEKLLEHSLLLLGRDVEPRTVFRDVLLGAPEDLPAIDFALADHFRDFRIVIVKHFAKKENGALHGRQAFEKQEESHGQRSVDSGNHRRIGRNFGH